MRTSWTAPTRIWALRMIKSSAEAEVMREVCDHTCEAFRIGFEALRGGMTERERSPGSSSPRWRGGRTRGRASIGIRSGRLKYTMMNVPPFDKVMEPGDLIVVGGAHLRDYWCDMMRMAAIGEPTAEQQRFFDVDLAAQRAGMEAEARCDGRRRARPRWR